MNGYYGGYSGYVGRTGLGQVPGPGGVGTLRPWTYQTTGYSGGGCCGTYYTASGFTGSGWGVGTGIIAIATLILIALGVIF